MRTAIIGTLMSKKRGTRCPEVVVSVYLSPIKADPKSVLLYRTIMDARRLLKKSGERSAVFFSQIRDMVQR